MNPISRRKALVVTGAGIAGALTSFPALAEQSELDTLLTAHSQAEARLVASHDGFNKAEGKYHQWKKTAKPRTIQFVLFDELGIETVDAVQVYTNGLQKLEGKFDFQLSMYALKHCDDYSVRNGNLRSCLEQHTSPELELIYKQQQDIRDQLDGECREIEQLPVVAEFLRQEALQIALCMKCHDADKAIIRYPAVTPTEQRKKAIWLNAVYGPGSPFALMEDGAEALLQSLFTAAGITRGAV